ncbi:MAG: histidinol-phosphatase [Pseudomonadota bacterium]
MKDEAIDADLRRVAHLLADAAGQAILPFFRSGTLVADNKLERGFDPVTQADRAAEQAMRSILARERPQDGILGEEFGTREGTSGLTWVLDPIDGTRAFIAGAPTWGVLIAVSTADGPIYGIIDQPFIAERFEGGAGQARTVGQQGERRLATRAPRALSEAILFTTFPEVGTSVDAAGFQAVASKVKLTRYGLDCYAYALVAAGQVDLVIEAGLAPYDIHAPIAVVTAAGGIVTDWRGNAAHEGGRVLVAANAQIHAEALAILRDF